MITYLKYSDRIKLLFTEAGKEAEEKVKRMLKQAKPGPLA